MRSRDEDDDKIQDFLMEMFLGDELHPRRLQRAHTPTAAGRLLLALQHTYGEQAAALAHLDPPEGPAHFFDVEAVAKLVGVWTEVEYVQEDPWATSYHLPGEVLYQEHVLTSPWRVLPVATWAGCQMVWEDA